MGIFFLLGILFWLGCYAFACYVIYRIVRKFDPAVSYGENLVPVYNYYLLLKQAVSRPGMYLLIMFCIGIFAVIVELATGGPRHPHPIAGFLNATANIIVAIMTARVWGLLAEKMGKNFWLYAVLSLIPIVNLIIILMLAFGDSQPIQGATSASLTSSTPPLPPAPPQDL